MLLRYFYDERLAQASYLVGCQRTGEAMVIDPTRDSTPYLQTAQKEGLRITHVAETHIHADFVSGSRELAAQTGANIYLSQMGDANWQYDYANQPNVILVGEGDMFKVGNIRIQVLHTPGHTPEHIAFMLTDAANAEKPMGIFTGDCLFVGDVGRPDLLEVAAGQVGSKQKGAHQQFKSVQRFKTLPDYLQIWPGHGAGSACGKALGAIPSSTLGYEKLFNPAFQIDEEDAFVQWLLDGQPEPPRYFSQMKQVNKRGPALLTELEAPATLTRHQLDEVIANGAFVVDLRSRTDFVKAHVPGTVSIPARANFSTYVGWLVDFSQPLYFITPAHDETPALVGALRAIGVDNLAGVAGPEVVLAGVHESLPEVSAQALAERLPQNNLKIIDVRNLSEWNEQHIAAAKHIQLGMLARRLAEIPQEYTIVTQCASGYRSQIASSWLRAKGYKNVINLKDGQERWSKVLPVTNN